MGWQGKGGERGWGKGRGKGGGGVFHVVRAFDNDEVSKGVMRWADSHTVLSFH